MTDILEEIRQTIRETKQRRVAEKFDMQEAALSKIKDGKQGFSVKSARQAGPIIDVAPAALYAGSQAAAISLKRAAGELDNPQLLRAVAGVLKGLESFSTQELAQDSETVRSAIGQLNELVSGAQKSVTSLERLGRDTAGLKTRKRFDQKPESKLAQKSGQTTLERMGRDTAGRKVRQRQV